MKRFFGAAVALALACSPLPAQTEWRSPLDNCGGEPYICGRAWNNEIGADFSRLPARHKGKVTGNVWALSRMSAGLSLRFATNSKTIRIKYVPGQKPEYLNMAWLNHSGVDLYGKDTKGGYHWIGNHMQWTTRGDTAVILFENLSFPAGNAAGAEFRLYLPPYNTVSGIAVGVDRGARFEFLREMSEKPVVVYGSSIVQGASPSRPGLMFTNIVGRRLNIPVVNHGYSGSAFMEPAVFDFLSEIDAAAYVLDPIPNSFGMGEEILRRAVAGVERLRKASDAPILMVEACVPGDALFRPDVCNRYVEGNKIWRRAFEKLRGQGVERLYYLAAADLHFTGEEMIEGAHPNDLGNIQYAKAYAKSLRKMLKRRAK